MRLWFTIKFFSVGTTNIKMKVSAPRCTYNRQGRFAKSPDEVTIEGDNMVVTGDDWAWDGPKELFKIFKNSKVVISNVRRGESANLLDVGGDSDDE